MTVQLLCHFDGTNGSSTFTDAAGHTLTALNGAVVNTSAPKFGTGAGDFTAFAVSAIDTGNTTDFYLGSGQFTIEAWGYFTSAPGGGGIYTVLSQYNNINPVGWFFGISSGQLGFAYSTTGSDNLFLGIAYTPTINTWIHLACDRDASNVVRVYANGAVIISGTVSAAIWAPASQTCLIGNAHNSSWAFPGRLDEARVVVGQAMYGGAFTPPSAPFIFNAAEVTQVSLEQWATTNALGQVTQVSLEQWASVAAFVPPTGGKARVWVQA
jgi:hypothetical protein